MMKINLFFVVSKENTACVCVSTFGTSSVYENKQGDVS